MNASLYRLAQLVVSRRGSAQALLACVAMALSGRSSASSNANRSRSRTPRSNRDSCLVANLTHDSNAKFCPDCVSVGKQQPSQKMKWCQGYCRRHATARGLSPPGQNSLAKRRSPTFAKRICLQCDQPARREKWCQSYCRRHATAQGLRPPRKSSTRRSPARGQDLTSRGERQKRRRCQEPGCYQRARVKQGEGYLCVGHAHWHRVFRLALRASGEVPSGTLHRRTGLGQWCRAQQSMMKYGSSKLSQRQRQLLKSKPRLFMSLHCYYKQLRVEKHTEECNRRVMEDLDIDYDDARIVATTLERDQALRKNTSNKAVLLEIHVDNLAQRSLIPETRQNAPRWKLPGSLNLQYPPVSGMAGKFELVVEGDISKLLSASCPQLANEKVAYRRVSYTNAHDHDPKPGSRLLTFATFAQMFPAFSVHLACYGKMRPQDLLGQQSRYFEFLEAVRFVGDVWRPCANAPSVQTRTPYPVQSGNYIQFGRTVTCSHCYVRFVKCCLPAWLEPGPCTVVKDSSWQRELCYPTKGRCTCEDGFTASEAKHRLYHMSNLISLNYAEVTHLAMALGMQLRSDETDNQLQARARMYVAFMHAEVAWAKAALKAIEQQDHDCTCLQSCLRLGQTLGITHDARRLCAEWLARLLSRVGELRAAIVTQTLSSLQLEDLTSKIYEPIDIDYP